MTTSDHERALAAAEQACKAWDHPMPVAVLEKVIEAYMREMPLQKRCEALEAALKPFALEAENWVSMWEDEHTPALHPKGNACSSCGAEPDCDVATFTIGDLRRARAALSTSKGETDGAS